MSVVAAGDRRQHAREPVCPGGDAARGLLELGEATRVRLDELQVVGDHPVFVKGRQQVPDERA
jgi:hypothetical protein